MPAEPRTSVGGIEVGGAVKAVVFPVAVNDQIKPRGYGDPALPAEGLQRAVVIVVGGLATWLLARPAVHIGASGLVFGYAGFLLVAGFVEKSVRGILVALIVGAFFGGMVLRGITPVASYVSWESHLFGLAAGVLAAFAIATPPGERVGA